MSAIGETLALASAGVMINNRTAKPEEKNQNFKSDKEKPNTSDIYAANNTRAVRDNYEGKTRNRFNDALNFRDTKVVPRFYKELDTFRKYNKNKKVPLIEGFSDEDSVFTDDDKT